MLFFVCFVFCTKQQQQQQQLQFVQYDGLPQHPNPNFQMLEDCDYYLGVSKHARGGGQEEELYEQQ
jgi:hypothetical protein